MEKSAQGKSGKRSLLNKLKEKTNISGIAAEKLFNPEFERVMNDIRETDNRIRAIVSGQVIEGVSPVGDEISLKELYKNAKSNINRREYMTAVAFLGRFHKSLYEISQIIKELNVNVDKVHNDFLFKDLDDDQKKHLHDLKSRLASTQYNLISNASVMDFLVNIGTERGRALAAWEKRYPKQVGKLKKDAANLVDKTANTLNNLVSLLKDLAVYRADRKVDEYVKVTEKITNLINNYDRLFKDFYNANVKGFLEKQELVAPVKEVSDTVSNQKVDVSNTSVNVNTQPISHVQPTIPDLETPLPNTSKSHEYTPLEEADTDLPPASNTGPHFSDLVELEKEMLTPPKVPNFGPNTPTTIPPFMHSEEIEEEEIPTVTEETKEETKKPEENEKPEEVNIHAIQNDNGISEVTESGEVNKNTEVKVEEEKLNKSTHYKFYNVLSKLSGEDPRVIKTFIKRYAHSIKSTDLETAIRLLKIASKIEG